MSIAPYLKEIARGRKGSRDLSRTQAADLMAQLLHGQISDVQLGAFCVAMRIKGESPEELAGFLDALAGHVHPVAALCPVLVLPSYNGARRQPCLTPLLALLLQQLGRVQGFATVLHGLQTEDRRVGSAEIFLKLNMPQVKMERADTANQPIALQAGDLYVLSLEKLSPALAQLLRVRHSLGLRNTGHSLAKMFNPIAGQRTMLVSPYTHPEYRASVAETFRLRGQSAILLRGTEGEPVADRRRLPEMLLLHAGQTSLIQAQQETEQIGEDKAIDVPGDAVSTADYIKNVLQGSLPMPAAIDMQARVFAQALQNL